MINFSIISKIIYYSFFIALGLFVVSKIISPLLMDFYNDYIKKKKKTKSPSLDHLIERQKLILRKGQEIQDNSSSKASKSEFFLSKRFQELSLKKRKTEKEDKELESLKSHIDLFNQRDWGLNDKTKESKQKLESYIKYSIQDSFIQKSLQTLVSVDQKYLHYFQKEPFYHKLPDLLIMITFYRLTYEDRFFKEKLSKELKASASFIDGFLALFLKVSLTNQKLTFQEFEEYILKNKKLKKDHLDSFILLRSFQQIYENNQTWKEAIHCFYDEINFISRLCPIQSIPKEVDDSTLLHILHFEQMPSEKSLKNYRKKILSDFHPDKLTSKLEGEEFQKMTSENFSLLNRAYDILEKRIKIKAD